MTSKNSRFRITPSTVAAADRLAEIQRACFPTIANDHLIQPAHYRAQIEKFPEGQRMVIDDNGTIVACCGDMRIDFDPRDMEHRYVEMVDHNWLGTHNPNGEWLYHFDISIHPEYQGFGLSRMIYDSSFSLARDLNLKGIIAGGMPKGYPAHKDQMDVVTYFEKLKSGDLFDPVVSVQLRRGFAIEGLIENYLDDPSCDNKAAFLIWRNPDFKT